MNARDANRGGLRGRMEEELNALRERSRFRTLETQQGVNFCSNDYLGLSRNRRLKEALIAVVKSPGAVGSTGSRLLSGNSSDWEELETEFARFAGTQAAVSFGSGFAANVGLLGAILKPGDRVYSDALNHASIIDGVRLSGATKIIYPHGDMEFLEKSLRENAHRPGAKVIVTESVFSMEGDVAPLERLTELARKYGAEVVVDEAHAVGVCGPLGRGVAAEMGIEREVLAIVYPCGKALASAGGMVCCSQIVRDFLINRARTFIFSTALPPYFAQQIRTALELARCADEERARLRGLGSALREALTSRGFSCGASSTQIVPVFLGSDEMALHTADQIRALGFGVRAIRPPSVPEGTARIRLSLTTRITFDDIHNLAEAFETARDSLPQTSPAGAVHA